MEYWTANSYRKFVESTDRVKCFSSYKEAKANLIREDDSDNAILAYIKDTWYRVKEAYDGTLLYKPINGVYNVGYHTLEEIEDGISIKDVPVEKMMALAAAAGYASGELAKSLGVSKEALYHYNFYDKYAEYFGAPMSSINL